MEKPRCKTKKPDWHDVTVIIVHLYTESQNLTWIDNHVLKTLPGLIMADQGSQLWTSVKWCLPLQTVQTTVSLPKILKHFVHVYPEQNLLNLNKPIKTWRWGLSILVCWRWTKTTCASNKTSKGLVGVNQGYNLLHATQRSAECISPPHDLHSLTHSLLAP